MGGRRLRIRLTIGLLGLCGPPSALAPEARSQTVPPSTPASASPPAPAVDQAAVKQLEERLRVMEDRNKKLADQLQRTSQEHEEQMKLLLDRFEDLSKRLDQERANPPSRTDEDSDPPATPGTPAPPVEVPSPVPDYLDGVFPSPGTGAAAPGAPQPSKRLLKANFGPGFRLRTADDEFRLQVQIESQIESRVWGQPDQVQANSGIYLPRQRIFFDGNITRKIEYELSINRGLNNINLLNAYVNLHLDDRFQVRLGRFFTPLPYDQFAISNYWLPTPERSLFTTNVGLNRQIGAMAWGFLLDRRLDYAVGVFNGSRNSFENLNNAVDGVAYLNVRPFQTSERLEWARFLNLGGSVGFGDQEQAPVPVSFRIGGGSPDANIPGIATVPFLILNRDVVERGDRLLGSVHAAYFRKGLSLIGEWQYGFGNYATASRPASVQVPLSGFYVVGGYFLTGEHVERRTRVKPLRPFVPVGKGERRGPGAWEAVGRVSQLSLGDEVFTAGFADPALWSNRATTTELGMNWYWNDYIKVYMFWLHGDFADPVLDRAGGRQRTADMFWLRFQLYF